MATVVVEVDRLLRSCSASYARFMGRLTREEKDLFLSDLPPLPEPLVHSHAPLPMIGAVGARSIADVLAIAQTGETVSLEDLGAIALYGVRSQGLGLLALQGQIVIVSLERDAQDGDAVVALNENRIYLRRLYGDQRDPSRIALACDRNGTERVPPTILLPRARTRLMPIIGVLYEQERFWRQTGEACPVNFCKLLERKLVAARVADDSAYPVIRSGDIVLLEAVNMESGEISSLEDRIVVATAGGPGESFAYLKRLGGEISSGVRILENVGVKGSALAVCTNLESASTGVHLLQALWRVHGTVRL